MWRQTVSRVTPALSLVAKRPLLAAAPLGSHFSTSVPRGYEFIIAEKKGEGGNVGLVTLNR